MGQLISNENNQPLLIVFEQLSVENFDNGNYHVKGNVVVKKRVDGVLKQLSNPLPIEIITDGEKSVIVHD